MNNLKLKYKPLHFDTASPKFGTSQSACFDICAYAGKDADFINAWTSDSKNIKLMPTRDGDGSKHYLIPPYSRVLVPTGLIFDIPEGYSVRIHARSGLATKGGLTMSNAEGIVDSDYINEVFISVYNISDVYLKINHGDRIAQGELVSLLRYDIEATNDEILQKTDRKGGFGSTGI